MISVVVPTLNAERELPRCLAALVPGAVDGLVREVLIVDGGSQDKTLAIADEAGAKVTSSVAGRGRQLFEGARQARGSWLLFLHADSVLANGWLDDAAQFIEAVSLGRKSGAAAFSFALDDDGLAPRVMESMVGWRAGLFKLPYGDQGLLISRALYDEIGGYNPLPLMEDVDIVRRLGRRRISILRSQAVTSAKRYREDGYLRRVVRNQVCLLLYAVGTPVDRIVSVYGAVPHKQCRDGEESVDADGETRIKARKRA